MGFMDNVSAFTKGVGQKAKGNYDVVAMTTQISGMQKEMKALYEKLGEKFYELHKEDAEEALASLVKELADIEKKIQDTKEQIEETKQNTAAVSLTVPAAAASVAAASVEKKCPECGTVLPADAMFCNACGTKYVAPASVAATPVAPATAAPVESAPAVQAAGPKSCPSCGAELSPEAAFCPECGTKVE